MLRSLFYGITGIGVADDVGLCGLADGLDEGPHLVGAERAVESDAGGLRVPDGGHEGLAGLPGERAPAHVDDRAGDEDGHGLVLGLEELLDGEEGRLRVGRVEDRLHEEDVHAAVEESARLLRVRVHHLVEG